MISAWLKFWRSRGTKLAFQGVPFQGDPGRVNSAFDMLSAGVVVLDDELRILMVNGSLAELVGKPVDALIGEKLHEWAWQRSDDWQAPWVTTFRSGLNIANHPMRLTIGGDRTLTFMVNCAPVGNDENGMRGVLVTLDDMTAIEQKNIELSETLGELHRSKEVISRKNEELEALATQDPLTGLENRRALLAGFEREYRKAVRENRELCCVILNIDHFKQVNDTLGHGAGDEVICAVANALTLTCREYDTVSRYGDEEYVVLLPDQPLATSMRIAERLGEAVFAMGKDPLVPVDRLSASIGVAALEPSVTSPMDMIERANHALYAARAAGGNRVMAYDSKVAQLKSKEGIAVEQSKNLSVGQESFSAVDAYLSPSVSIQTPPERETVLQRVDVEIQRSHKQGQKVGVLSIEFKDLNRIITSMGHNGATMLVIELESRFEECLAKTDKVAEFAEGCRLARIAPNEYGVILVDLDEVGSAMSITTGLRRLLVEPIVVDGQKIHVGANLGVAIFPGAGERGVDLYDNASRARAKAGIKPEKVGINFFSETIEQASRDYIQLESDLFEVFDKNQLDVHFQPFYDLQSRRITALEALIRWNHPTRGSIQPEAFISIAEASGLIHRITVLVMERAVALLNEWRKLGLEDIRISVNISPLQLHEPTLVPFLLGTMSRAGLSTDLLEVEITESAVIDSPQRAKIVLDRLRDAGIRLAMDDFGTGYSSLALLAELALDSVKIDRSFVEAMTNNERGRSVVESIINMAHALNLNVVGEGVETNDQLDMLKALGCQEAQGFLIARPMPAEQALEFLEEQAFIQKRSSN